MKLGEFAGSSNRSVTTTPARAKYESIKGDLWMPHSWIFMNPFLQDSNILKYNLYFRYYFQ